MPAIEQARSLIERRLAEIEQERASLHAALSSLRGTVGREPPTRIKTTRPLRRRRAARGQRQAEFLEAIKTEPGAPMAQIAKKMGVAPQQLYPIARRLSDQGTIAKRNGGYAPHAARANRSL